MANTPKYNYAPLDDAIVNEIMNGYLLTAGEIKKRLSELSPEFGGDSEFYTIIGSRLIALKKRGKIEFVGNAPRGCWRAVASVDQA